MTIKLTRPIAFFDLETTGTSVSTDRIISIAVRIVYPVGWEIRILPSFYSLVKPANLDVKPLPAEITEITGITAESLETAPSFKDIAFEVLNLFRGCDLGGHNITTFDLPLLVEEFLRVDATIEFPEMGYRIVDTKRLFEKIMPRTLDSAFLFFTGHVRTGESHRADADVDATIEVFKNQVEKFYPTVGEHHNDWHQISTYGKTIVDFANRITVDEEGFLIWTFGKNINRRVMDDSNYCSWVLTSDFSADTKRWVRHALKNDGRLKPITAEGYAS